MPGTLLVNKIGAATGTEISFETGHSMAFTTAQFKLTGGTAGQAITTDGSGNLTFADMTSDPTMGGDLSGLASNAQIAPGAVDTAEIAADAVTANEIVAGAIGSSEIATDAVTTGKINSDVVTDREIAANAVSGTEIAATFDISSKTVTLPEASVTAHVTIPVVNGKNYVINGGFDLWQRGASFTSTSYYQWYADRWNGDAYNGNGFLITKQTASTSEQFRYYLRFNRPSASTAAEQRRIGQVFETEHIKGMNGQAMTLSWYMKKGANWSPGAGITSYFITGTGFNESTGSVLGHGTTGVVTDNQNNVITSSWTRFSHTYTLPADANQLAIQFVVPASTGTAGAADDWDIGGIKLELGSTATPFINEDVGDTLDQCQRFYQKSYNLGVAPGTASSGPGSTSSVAIYSSGSQHLGDRFPKRMRTAPTITIYSPGTGASGNSQAASNNADIATSASEIGESGFQFISGGLPTGDNGMRWHWVAQAEL